MEGRPALGCFENATCDVAFEILKLCQRVGIGHTEIVPRKKTNFSSSFQQLLYVAL